MARDILMPQMGYDMTEGTIVRWTKKVGDRVHKGDVVAEIETDKATVEIEAFDSGTLLRTVAAPGDTVPVGQPIATLGEPGETLPQAPAPRAQASLPAEAARAARDVPAVAPEQVPARAAAAPTPAQPAPAPRVSDREPGEWIRASPLARRLASDLGVDLAQVVGTGPGGRVVRADVEGAADSGAAPAEGDPEAPTRTPLPEGAEDIEPTRLRQAIARRMAEAKRTIPHFYVAIEIDAEPMQALRAALAAKKVKVSVNDVLVKALALTALQHPEVNAAYIGGRVRRFARVDIGIAVATDAGLLSPALLDCGHKPLKKIAQESRDLAERARTGRLHAEEVGGGTLTLSNLGMYGVSEFLAIINPPQAMIVSVGAALDRPVVRDGKVAAGKTLTAWAAADHRVLDGADVARFLADFKALLESPKPIGS